MKMADAMGITIKNAAQGAAMGAEYE